MSDIDRSESDKLTRLIGQDPVLIIGRRHGKAIETRYVNLHQDTFESLRGIASSAARRIDAMRERPYEVTAELEPGEEYFSVSISDLTSERPPKLEVHQFPGGEIVVIDDPFAKPSPVDQFFRSIQDLGQLGSLDAAHLGTMSFLFYAVAFQKGDESVIFFRKRDPSVLLKRGALTFTYQDTLVKVQKPDFMLDDDVDFIVSDSAVLIMNKTAFELIIPDLRVALQDVPQATMAVEGALKEHIPLHANSLAAINAACGKRLSFAVRLRALQPRILAAQLSALKVKESMEQHGEDPNRLINKTGEFEFGVDDVAMFLDVLEGRLFEDDFTGEKRRADRLSAR